MLLQVPLQSLSSHEPPLRQLSLQLVTCSSHAAHMQFTCIFYACCMQVLVGLASASSSATSAGALRQSVPEKTVVGIFRDLRGIAMATNSRRTYGQCLLFQTALHTTGCKHDAYSIY